MAINMTINTTPISEFLIIQFIIKFGKGVGAKGFMIIALCLLTFFICSWIQEERSYKRRMKEISGKRYYD